MTLSELIKKGGLAKIATMTPATIATQETGKVTSVAEVATVAVAVKPEPLLELPPDEENRILAWLAHIEETDPSIITEVINKCRDDSDARQFFMQRSEEVPQTIATNELISCGECAYFERTEHPHLGHCAKGEPEAIVGLWDADHRYCGHYQSKPSIFRLEVEHRKNQS